MVGADFNVVKERVVTSDGSLSNYGVLHGLAYLTSRRSTWGWTRPSSPWRATAWVSRSTVRRPVRATSEGAALNSGTGQLGSYLSLPPRMIGGLCILAANPSLALRSMERRSRQ